MTKRIKVYHNDSDEPIEIYEADLKSFERKGWTVKSSKKSKGEK
tara:strand:+ start:300 stop:431 length:132 start_codon:yes stop_codon:yes gene_type:complete